MAQCRYFTENVVPEYLSWPSYILFNESRPFWHLSGVARQCAPHRPRDSRNRAVARTLSSTVNVSRDDYGRSDLVENVSPLLSRLSAELRVMIYRYVFDARETRYIKSAVRSNDEFEETLTDSALARTCKQIRSEFLAVYYDSVAFRTILRSWTDEPSNTFAGLDLWCWTEDLGADLCRHVKHLEIEIDFLTDIRMREICPQLKAVFRCFHPQGTVTFIRNGAINHQECLAMMHRLAQLASSRYVSVQACVSSCEGSVGRRIDVRARKIRKLEKDETYWVRVYENSYREPYGPNRFYLFWFQEDPTQRLAIRKKLAKPAKKLRWTRADLDDLRDLLWRMERRDFGDEV